MAPAENPAVPPFKLFDIAQSPPCLDPIFAQRIRPRERMRREEKRREEKRREER
jgi:hypothetical protein